MKKPATLYVRTSLTIFIALFLFMGFASAVVFQFLMQPLARQAAGDMAAMMVLSAQTWVELPSDARLRLEAELETYHNISITEHNESKIPVSTHHPFIRFLKEELERRLDHPVSINKDASSDNDRVFVDIPMSDMMIHISFPHHHIGANPPAVIFLLLMGAAILIFVTSSFLVRRLTRPLEQLSQATTQMGRGKEVQLLEESGAKELVLLTRSFNQMNHRVQQLLDNRNTLLAGISHDLRTPISRIHLALELLEGEQKNELLTSIRGDLDEMNQLLEQTLELAINDKKILDKLERMDVNHLVSTVIDKFSNQNKNINWHPSQSACLAEISLPAFQRIVQNLIENAIRYGQGLPIDIYLECIKDSVKVCVADQGPGIPAEFQSDIFQPFFRLETSRNIDTGGKGLGLAIVKQLCDLYEWDIQLNTNNNNGCTFCLIVNKRK